MKLLKLILHNFQGIRNLEIDLDGRNANIYGDNATGKTTIYNAVTWLLFDKASTGAKSFSPKTKGKDGRDIHYLDHSVTAEIQLDSGVTMTLQKSLSENWKKIRGSINEEFSGHKTEYRIDGVPTSESEYNTVISEICSPEKAKILTMTSHFPEELPWQTRRKILLEVCGDITDEDVINSSPRLEKLDEFLTKKGITKQKYTVDEYQKIASSRKAELNREIDSISSRIDEAKKAIPDLTGYSLEQVNKTIHEAELKKADLEQEKAMLSEETAVRELKAKRSELLIQLNDAKSDFLKTANNELEQSNIAIQNLQIQLNELEKQHDQLERDKTNITNTRDAALAEREKISQKYVSENVKEWQGSTMCYACKQPLPAEQINDAVESWNKNKAEILNEIRKQMETSCSKIIIAELEERLLPLAENIANIECNMNDTKQQIHAMKSSLPSAKKFEETHECASVQSEIAQIDAQMHSDTNRISEAKKSIQSKIEALSTMLQNHANDKAKFVLSDAQELRISELMEREKELSNEYEKLQQGVYLCEEFIKAKVSMLTEKINAKFENVSFRLFVQQINGGIKEDCEVLVPGEDGLVPYSTANNAARINAGIEIINVLSKHWKTQMPLFIDNRESVVRLAESDMQIISLIVSETDQIIRVNLL